MRIDWKKAIDETYYCGQCESFEMEDGRPVRVYADDHGGVYPIIGATMDSPGFWVTALWQDDAMMVRGGKFVPKKHKGTIELYVNVYPKDARYIHDTKRSAEQHKGKDRLACVHVKVPWEEGQGLEDEEDTP